VLECSCRSQYSDIGDICGLLQVHAQHHAQVLDTLLSTLRERKDDEDWEHTRDNAVAAVGKILMHHENLTGGAMGMDLAKVWVQHLPLYCDEVEAAKQHEMLHHFLLKNDPRVLGENNGNLPAIAEVFVRVIARGSSLLPDAHVQPFREFFMRQLSPVLEAHGCVLQEIVQKLDPHDQYMFAQASKGSGA
jgi:hypothetical protein